MTTEYFFEPQRIDIPSRENLRTVWNGILDIPSREILIKEHQFLIFQLGLLDKLKFKSTDLNNNITDGPIFDGLRVGAIRAALMVTASITEEALLCHAISRRYKFEKQENGNDKQMLGEVAYVWKNQNWPDLGKKIGGKIHWLMDIRNHVHLRKIIENGDRQDKFYLSIERNESKYIARANTIIEALTMLRS